MTRSICCHNQTEALPAPRDLFQLKCCREFNLVQVRIPQLAEQCVDAPIKFVLRLAEISKALMEPFKQVECVNLAFRLDF